MVEQTVVIKMKDGDPLVVSKGRLTADSRMLRYLIDELNYDVVEMDDFETETVSLFLSVLDDKKLKKIEKPMFREIHKMGVVFEVNWLKEDCRSWLVEKIESVKEDRDKVFTFDECWFIVKKWEEWEMMHKLLSALYPQDNSAFISDYMSNIDKLEFGQIDLMLDLGGSDTKTFLMIIQHNLTRQTTLNKNLKYLLRNMNLALCSEVNEELYLEVMKKMTELQDISNTDLRFVTRLMIDTAKSVRYYRDRKNERTIELHGGTEFEQLFGNFKTLSAVTNAVTKGHLKSMFLVIEVLLNIFLISTPAIEDMQLFITTLDRLHDRQMKKVSLHYINLVKEMLKCSNLEQSKLLITLLDDMKNNAKLCKTTENIIIKQDENQTGQFVFKHPLSGTCTKSGSKCGFLLRFRSLVPSLSFRQGVWQMKIELYTRQEAYKNTEIHLHDEVSAHDMFWYRTCTGIFEGSPVTAVGRNEWWKRWLPHVTDWKTEEFYVAYNVADYRVAKRK